MSIFSRYAVCFLLTILASSAAFLRHTVADELSKDEVVRLVLDHYRANYAPLKTIQAKVHVLISTPEKPNLQQKPTEGEKEEAPPPVDTVRLKVSLQPRLEVEWKAKIAGENEIYEEDSENGHRIVLRRGKKELKYLVGHSALLYQVEPEKLRSNMHFDPRQMMFANRLDNVEWLLSSDRVREATMVADDDGQSMARLVVESLGSHVLIIMCPKSADYLPTRVFQINNSVDPAWQGVVQIGTEATYGRHTVNDKKVLFPTAFHQRNGVGTKSLSIEEFMQGQAPQTVTITVSDLKLNEKLEEDAFDCPFIVPGTRIENQIGPVRNMIPAKF